MSKIYHIKPKNQTKPPKDPLWKYIIDLSGLYDFIMSTRGILNR